MSGVKLEWITPNAEKMIVDMARVSADPTKKGQPDHKLVGYLIRNSHWSPFEMANICIEVDTTRDIGRQMLRHWTARPQEFSQRYQDVSILGDPVFRECRMQHPTNRQASESCEDPGLSKWWLQRQKHIWDEAVSIYRTALERGIAKEVARAVLPEGLTPTRMFFNFPIRTALHFCGLRRGHGTQKEAVALAEGLWLLIQDEMPTVAAAYAETQGWD